MLRGATDGGSPSARGGEESPRRGMWLISSGRYVDYDFSRIYKGGEAKNIREYRISDLARYMLNPNPIRVSRRLVGCEVRYRQSTSSVKDYLMKVLPIGMQLRLKRAYVPSDVFMADSRGSEAPLKNADLESHLEGIYDLLKPHDSLVRRLSKLDRSRIYGILGICRDIAGNDSYLNIEGNIEEKIDYVKDWAMKDVEVILDKAQISDGLFEMKAFDFQSKNPMNSHWLVKLTLNGEQKACVLDSNNKIAYWVDDIGLIYYIQLLQQLLKEDRELVDSLNLCVAGKAEPFKLFFNRQLAIDYKDGHFPALYKELFEAYNIQSRHKRIVAEVIGKSQLGVSFHYVPHSHADGRKLLTNVSVMHDVEALEPIREDLPQICSEIDRRSCITEVGRFYLLDSIRGHKDEK